MNIAFFGDSLTEGIPGVSYFDILREQLPDHSLYNYGRSGDTVRSLYSRIKRTRFPGSFDIAFLWIGTNDVLVDISPVYPVVKTLINQPWTRGEEEFSQYYRKVLGFLKRRAGKIYTVSPLFIGEDLRNEWNHRMGRLGDIISSITEKSSCADYVDLRREFQPHLEGVQVSDYLPESMTRVGLDVLALRGKQQVDERSARRGLLFTLDGVHLNSAGAELVAQVFRREIEKPPQN